MWNHHTSWTPLVRGMGFLPDGEKDNAENIGKLGSNSRTFQIKISTLYKIPNVPAFFPHLPSATPLDAVVENTTLLPLQPLPYPRYLPRRHHTMLVRVCLMDQKISATDMLIRLYFRIQQLRLYTAAIIYQTELLRSTLLNTEREISAVTILSKEPHTVPPPSPVEWRPTLNKERKELSTNWCGVLLAFLSGTFFTLSSAALKALKSVDPMELLMIRSALQVAVMLAVACQRGHNVVGPRGYRLLLQLQGIVGGITLVLLFYSFRRLPLGDATTIIFSSPMFVMLLSLIFLREPCGFFRTTVVCLLLAGVILISKPPFIFQVDITSISKPPFIFQFFVHETHTHHYDVVGYACAVTATLFTAFNMVVMRKCKDVHFSVVVLQLSSWSLLVAGVLLGALGRHHGEIIVPPRGLLQWGLAVVVSVFGLSGQATHASGDVAVPYIHLACILTLSSLQRRNGTAHAAPVLVARALSLEGAGRVAVTRSLDIILAFLLQVFVFGEIPDWLSVLGASFVLVCVIGMGLEEHIHYLASLVP
uniref:EamA domain-containing protein n=1 Tax=Timema bartmani TaxID=61472 RepID=A0A7R9I0X3_9NEOP|nr:unnamed protein product [Timema bartmani]